MRCDSHFKILCHINKLKVLMTLPIAILKWCTYTISIFKWYIIYIIVKGKVLEIYLMLLLPFEYFDSDNFYLQSFKHRNSSSTWWVGFCLPPIISDVHMNYHILCLVLNNSNCVLHIFSQWATKQSDCDMNYEYWSCAATIELMRTQVKTFMNIYSTTEYQINDPRVFFQTNNYYHATT